MRNNAFWVRLRTKRKEIKLCPTLTITKIISKSSPCADSHPTNSEPPLQTDLITLGTNKAICNYTFFGLIRQSKMTVLPGALYQCRAHPSDFEIPCYLFIPGRLSRVFSGLLASAKQKGQAFRLSRFNFRSLLCQSPIEYLLT